MTARRSLKRLVRRRMDATGETYTAALAAVEGPDSRSQPRQGEPVMTTSNPEPSATTSDAEGTAVPILPARDIPETLAFFERLGFTTATYEGDGYAFVRRGGIELQYAHNPDVDPFATAAMAFIRVR